MKSREKGAKGGYKYIIGIDEVGRGPIAGPVTLGAVLFSREDEKRMLKALDGVKDSKQLSAKQREAWFARLKAYREKGELDFAVASISSARLDTLGLTQAIYLCIKKILEKLGKKPEECRIVLDGLLHAPKVYLNQETIIGGDESVPIIALASIAAKVIRDRKMIRFAKKYPQYGFHEHKGYGTPEHYRQIKVHGLCEIHRRSFLRNLS